VTLTYVDASAAVKLLNDEAESDALVEFIEQSNDRHFVASWLLDTEVRCALGRAGIELDPTAVSEALGVIELDDLQRRDLRSAGTKAPLRSNDAIHLSVALRLDVDEMLVYDKELVDASRRAGITTVSPA
jgi:predicted nucleic acid-binding protein